jgi:hypothetical protein
MIWCGRRAAILTCLVLLGAAVLTLRGCFYKDRRRPPSWSWRICRNERVRLPISRENCKSPSDGQHDAMAGFVRSGAASVEVIESLLRFFEVESSLTTWT